MKYQDSIGKFDVVVECSEDLQEQARGLLAKLQELNQRGPELADATTIDFGWSRLTLRADGTKLVVCEPDFNSDPSRNSVPGVDRTLRVLTEQVAILNHVGAEGVTAKFSDKVVMAKGCLEAPHIYMQRSDTQFPGDSGWYIGDVHSPKENVTAEDLEAIYVYQLLAGRRSLVKVLALPPEYMVIFDGDEIEALFDETGKDVWPVGESSTD